MEGHVAMLFSGEILGSNSIEIQFSLTFSLNNGLRCLFESVTEVEVFLDKRVRETRQTAGANSRRGATKKREISRNLL